MRYALDGLAAGPGAARHGAAALADAASSRRGRLVLRYGPAVAETSAGAAPANRKRMRVRLPCATVPCCLQRAALRGGRPLAV